jgi:hypothetical protein
VLYNGENALAEGRSTLNASYKDNYWELLPIERMEIRETVKLESQDNNPNFIRAEEKAVKAVQKHSMNIKGKQRNPQIDEAYMLLGKARYFDQRFVPALEAFNYVLYNYPESDKFPAARVWREKVNIRLDNNELAIDNLKLLFRSGKLDNQVYADGKAIMAQAYINLKYKDSAVQALKLAANLTELDEEKGRYNFIIGQLYNELGSKDTASMAFDRVIALNRKIPRNYLVNAQLQKIKNVDLSTVDKLLFEEALTEMEENRENRPFLDKIFRQKAEFHLANDSIIKAVDYINRSLRKTQGDAILNAMNYEDLAEINFNSKSYVNAGAYYDSTLTNLVEATKHFRTIRRKRNNLQDVIKYEGVVKRNDSIMTLVQMSQSERMVYFNNYIEGLKEDAAALKENEQNSRATSNEFAVSSGGGQATSGQFYFYNSTLAAYGKSEFKKTWGERVLEDNWRLASKNTVANIVDEDEVQTVEEVISDDELYDVAYYLGKIPATNTVIDSLENGRNFANYQLGLIYKEKFSEYELAATKLEKVLANTPQEKLIIPSKYNLFKLYELLGWERATYYKNDIVSNHSESRYAKILLNPQQALSQDGTSSEFLYGQLYKKFEKQEYEPVISESNIYINRFNGEDIVPKFEMLKATALGKLKGYEAYKEALNFVALTYPNNPEGKEAQNIIDNTLPKFFKNKFFKKDVGGRSFKLAYIYDKQNAVTINTAHDSIISVFEQKDLRSLKVSKDVYDERKMFVVVHGFQTANAARGFANIMLKNKNYVIDDENFVILTANYEILQVHKNLEEYLNNQSNNP